MGYMKKIVIVGAGFAGVYIAKRLLKKLKKNTATITMISEQNYFLFTPMLHEVATGGISRENIIQPISHIFHNTCFAFLKGYVTHVNPKTKTVYTKDFSYNYDILILATGSQITYRGIKGADKYALPLRTLSDAYVIKNRVIQQLYQAEKTKNTTERKKYLSFAIIGGGPSGVELAGELGEFIKELIVSHRINAEEVNITIFHNGQRILSHLPTKFSERCQKKLAYLKVNIQYNTIVKEVGVDFIKDQQGKKYFANTIFWTAGFSAKTIPLGKKSYKRYPVDPYFNVQGYKDIFALGDCAFIEIQGKPVPMLAQLAVKQSHFVTHNILYTLGLCSEKKKYKYQLDGFLISVGQYFGVAGIKKVYFSGFFAWWLWRTIYLMKLLGFSNKVRVAIDWTLNFFYPRDTSEIVTNQNSR